MYKPNDLILRTTTSLIAFILLGFSVYLLLAGHNAPGGGFVGGINDLGRDCVNVYGIWGRGNGESASGQLSFADSLWTVACRWNRAGIVRF